MNLKQALEYATANKTNILIPVKMGFFCIIRPAKDTRPAPSLTPQQFAQLGLAPDVPRHWEVTACEVNFKGIKEMPEIHGTWARWVIEASDLERTTFMVI